MIAALAALALLAAGGTEQQAFTVDASQSVVRYHVHHPLHAADGRSSSIEGKAILQPDGKVLAMVRMPVATFDSGDANRDSNMRDALEASRFPFVVFKGVTSLVMPAASGKAIPKTMEGELQLHGVTHPVEVPVTLEFAPDGSVTAKGTMTLGLESYGIQRPSLLMIKLDDACRIDFDLKLRKG